MNFMEWKLKSLGGVGKICKEAKRSKMLGNAGTIYGSLAKRSIYSIAASRRCLASRRRWFRNLGGGGPLCGFGSYE